MANIKVVILKTDEGVRLKGNMQCSNKAWWDAEGCFNYCQERTEDMSRHQSLKLKSASTTIGHETTTDDWYRHRENFIDVEINIPVECTQAWQLGI